LISLLLFFFFFLFSFLTPCHVFPAMKADIAQQGKDDEENKGGESVESRLRSSQV